MFENSQLGIPSEVTLFPEILEMYFIRLWKFSKFKVRVLLDRKALLVTDDHLWIRLLILL